MSSENNTFGSKCGAIQYGIMIVGIVLILMMTFYWYEDYTNSCVASCNLQHRECRSKCMTTVNTPPAEQTESMTEPELERFVNTRSTHFSEPSLEGEDWDPSKLALEQAVFDSHREFIHDAYINVQGATSTNSVRDDTNDINPRVGLRRVDYTGVFSGDDARTVSSEYPDQIAQSNVGQFLI